MEIKNEPLRKAYIEVYSLFLNYFILSKKMHSNLTVGVH